MTGFPYEDEGGNDPARGSERVGGDAVSSCLPFLLPFLLPSLLALLIATNIY